MVNGLNMGKIVIVPELLELLLQWQKTTVMHKFMCLLLLQRVALQQLEHNLPGVSDIPDLHQAPRVSLQSSRDALLAHKFD